LLLLLLLEEELPTSHQPTATRFLHRFSSDHLLRSSSSLLLLLTSHPQHMADQQARFEQAVALVSKVGGTLDTNTQLQVYALYKQATCGVCTTSKPSLWDFRGNAKWYTLLIAAMAGYYWKGLPIYCDVGRLGRLLVRWIAVVRRQRTLSWLPRYMWLSRSLQSIDWFVADTLALIRSVAVTTVLRCVPSCNEILPPTQPTTTSKIQLCTTQPPASAQQQQQQHRARALTREWDRYSA
jgi:acyl-CoA-binding protein